MMTVRLRSRLKEFRARHGLTQEQLAGKVGVRRETIVHIENNRYNPSLILAYRLSRAVESTIEEVFRFEAEDE